MLAQHLHAVLQIASETNTVIGFRPVSWAAKHYIEAGYPSKNFHIKTKSAQWGPQLGLLCPKATETIDEVHAIRGNLFLDHARISELLEKGCIRLEREKQNANNRTTGFDEAPSFIFYADEPAPEKTTSTSGANTQSATTHQYQAVKIENTAEKHQAEAPWNIRWDIKKLDPESETASTPVQVLYCPVKNLPITADYDLLTYARPIIHKNDTDNQPLMRLENLLTFTLTQQFLTSQSRINLSLSGVAHHESNDATKTSHSHQNHSASNNILPATAEDPHRGNVSPFTNKLIDLINLTLTRGENLNMVHHNIEAHSPFAKENSCYPAIFCLPGEQPRAFSSDANRAMAFMNRPMRSSDEDTERWNGDRVVLINTMAEMTQLKDLLENNGYHLEVSPTFIGGGGMEGLVLSKFSSIRSSHSGMF